MRPIVTWEEAFQNEIERVKEVFLTRSQFNQVIRTLLSYTNCPISGLEFELNCSTPFKNFVIGSAESGTPDAHTAHIEDNRSTTCRIRQWEGTPVIPKPENFNNLLEVLFTAYWKPQLRTESAGLPDLKRAAEAVTLSKRTVDAHRIKDAPCSVLFCDLDNFGQVNKQLTHDEGDRIIKEFGAILEETTLDEAVVLHNGGDEFILLLPGAGAQDALLLGYKVKQAVSTHDFRTPNIVIGVSIGIASSDVDRDAATFEELKNRANQALIEFAKKPEKGLIRFWDYLTIPESVQEVHDPLGNSISLEEPACDRSSIDKSIENSLNFAHCLVKSNLLSSAPFVNVWMNCLSQIVADALRPSVTINSDSSWQRVRAAIENFNRWAKITSIECANSKVNSGIALSLDASCSLSPLDQAYAIAHGVFRCICEVSLEQKLREVDSQAAIMEESEESQSTAVSLTIKHDATCRSMSLCLSDGNVIWTIGDSSQYSSEFSLGNAWQMAQGNPASVRSGARAILVQIGHDNSQVPMALFAERLVVDDRPTRGGGLPDFWEAAIARLVTHVVKNPNIVAVYVWGNLGNAARTVAKLANLDAWDREDEEIAYRTGMPVQTIRTAVSLLRGKVSFPQTKEELVADLAEKLRSSHAIKPISEILNSQARFLTRDLHLNERSLNQSDGCRVGTIGEAFPIVLEIVRKTSGETIIKDQAGQELRELFDFKVHLTNPTQDVVPTFYSNEKNSMEKYFEDAFINDTKLFGQKFKESDQLESVLNHVGTVINDSSHDFATRRAILVIPHETTLGKDLTPLGLVSVRLVLRFPRGRIRIHYSYTWRTVEAFVGFPYSLYGSVRFGQYLTDQIRLRLHPDLVKQLEMGEVSYIAHSLHMFMDDYGQNIARRIVDDASL